MTGFQFAGRQISVWTLEPRSLPASGFSLPSCSLTRFAPSSRWHHQVNMAHRVWGQFCTKSIWRTGKTIISIVNTLHFLAKVKRSCHRTWMNVYWVRPRGWDDDSLCWAVLSPRPRAIIHFSPRPLSCFVLFIYCDSFILTVILTIRLFFCFVLEGDTCEGWERKWNRFDSSFFWLIINSVYTSNLMLMATK